MKTFTRTYTRKYTRKNPRRKVIMVTLIAFAMLSGCTKSTERGIKQTMNMEQSADAALESGMKAFQRQDYDNAIKNYEEALKQKPKSSLLYNLLGMAYRFKFNKGGGAENQKKEIAAFEKAIELDDRNWLAMINLAATQYYRGTRSEALPLFKKALEVNPNNPEKMAIMDIILELEADLAE